MLRLGRSQVPDELPERNLEVIVVLPIREIRNEVLPYLVRHVFTEIGVEALPLTQKAEVAHSNRKKLSPPSVLSTFSALLISVMTHSLWILLSERISNSRSCT
jgi:hypothetical protein